MGLLVKVFDKSLKHESKKWFVFIASLLYTHGCCVIGVIAIQLRAASVHHERFCWPPALQNPSSFTWDLLETDFISITLHNRWQFSPPLRCQQKPLLHQLGQVNNSLDCHWSHAAYQIQIRTQFHVTLIWFFFHFRSTRSDRFLLASPLWMYPTSACLLLYLCAYVTVARSLSRAQTKSFKWGANKSLSSALSLFLFLFPYLFSDSFLTQYKKRSTENPTTNNRALTYFQKSMEMDLFWRHRK